MRARRFRQPKGSQSVFGKYPKSEGGCDLHGEAYAKRCVTVTKRGQNVRQQGNRGNSYKEQSAKMAKLD